jgi:membrane-associated phospholipid phosphatase
VTSERRTGLVLACVLVGLLLVLGLVVRGGPLAIDAAIADGIAAWFPPTATDIFNFLGTLPVFAAVGLAGTAICWIQGRQSMAVAFLVGLSGEAATTLVKLVIDRPRPPGGTDVEAFITAASYPSGHVVRTVVVAGLLVAAFAARGGAGRWLAIVAGITVVALVGCARIASHEHWPTDVVGGVLLGGAWLIGCLTVEAALSVRRRPPA